MAVSRKKTVSGSGRKADTAAAIIEAALGCAARRAWSEVTLREIADAGGVSLSVLRRHFSGKDAIVDAFFADIDGRLVDHLDDDTMSASPRERLFELLMARFEMMVAHKAALWSMTRSFSRDPVGLVPAALRLGTAMRWTLEAAGLATGGVGGLVRIQGLSVLFLAVFRVWLRDESPDMSATLAALDRWLDKAEDFAGRDFTGPDFTDLCPLRWP